ncbi:MAG TPA: hypothetical protein VMG41_17020 [Gemmatimonadales bacterium]|nr:hypothetical protein [Gemmatimonadales bacterium]
MPQWFRLDHLVGLSYLALGLAACHSSAPVLIPKGVATVDSARVAGWVARTIPKSGELDRFRWLYEDEKASKGGRGSARIVPPDTLRFDFAGSLGVGKGSAMVVGDSALWVVPDRSVDELVPGIALLWSVLGVARPPDPGAQLTGLEEAGRTAWRYAVGADTVEYLLVNGDPVTLYAEVRRAGKVLGRSEMTSRADGTPIEARLTVPTVPSKLEITYYASVPHSAFPPETWTRPPEP